jgi:hypothetical protein
MDIVVNVNIDTGGEQPKVEVKKPLKKKPMKAGGVLQFPAMPVDNNPVLDVLGIKET